MNVEIQKNCTLFFFKKDLDLSPKANMSERPNLSLKVALMTRISYENNNHLSSVGILSDNFSLFSRYFKVQTLAVADQAQPTKSFLF